MSKIKVFILASLALLVLTLAACATPLQTLLESLVRASMLKAS